MDLKDRVINSLSILALLHGPIVWPLRAANLRPLCYVIRGSP